MAWISAGAVAVFGLAVVALIVVAIVALTRDILNSDWTM